MVSKSTHIAFVFVRPLGIRSISESEVVIQSLLAFGRSCIFLSQTIKCTLMESLSRHGTGKGKKIIALIYASNGEREEMEEFKSNALAVLRLRSSCTGFSLACSNLALA